MARLDWYIRANLKPRHLQLLLALDEVRHVGKVAAYLNITQPAVSKTLAELERGLEMSLFNRGAKGLAPTPQGECMVRLARKMLRELDVARDELRQLQAGTSGRVRLGVLPVGAPVLAPRAIMRFQKHAPMTSVVLHEGNSSELLPRLKQGLLDLVLGTLPPPSLRMGLRCVALCDNEPVLAVCGTSHPLVSLPAVTAADVGRYPLVVPPLESIFRETVESAMEALGIQLQANTIDSGSMTVTNALVAAGEAISLYSAHLARHYARLGRLHILPLTPRVLSFPVGVVLSVHHEPTPSVQLMIEQLRLVADETFNDERSAAY